MMRFVYVIRHFKLENINLFSRKMPWLFERKQRLKRVDSTR